MQTSEHLIVYQTVSLEAYQRLRETLMQQGNLFESVVTESRLEGLEGQMDAIARSLASRFAQMANKPENQAQAQKKTKKEATVSSFAHNDLLPDSLLSDDLIQNDRPSRIGSTASQQQSSHQTLSHQTLSHQTSQSDSQGSQAGPPKNHRKSRKGRKPLYKLSQAERPSAHSYGWGHSEATSQGADVASETAPSGGDLGVEGFVLMCSPAINVLLTATSLADQPSPVSLSNGYQSGHQKSDRSPLTGYRVGLTFDDRAIAVFVNRLKGSAIRTASGVHPNVRTQPTVQPNHPASLPSSNSHQPVKQLVKHPLKQSLNLPIAPTAASSSTDEKIMAQEAFVLNWAKHLATSPEGDAQSAQVTLDNQIQQSLLLNQVVTRIRHSLDLPATLETTVAQVREFLAADRLVLYQFDQFGTLDPREPSESPLWNPANRAVGQSVHSGHVTYESRVSQEIPSVLHLAEKECFEPSLPMRSRYLKGQPIAVDNVEQRYADTQCLLNFLRQAQVKSKIIAPIIVQGRLWGLLIAHQCQAYRHWEDAEAVFLQHIAEHLAVAIGQASLYQQLRQQTVSLESCVIERTQNLHDALVAAESANVTKGEFISTMSHELRTPLTYIIGMSATLLRWSFGDLSDRQRSYLTTINQSGEKLLDIINNILEYAQVEAGRSLLDFSEFSLTQLADTVVSHYRALAEKQDITLSSAVDISPELDAFRADDKRLQQILSNLIQNAIKFTPAGGQVSLRVLREPNTAIFEIEDTGIGIPESQREVLFEKFKQLESPFQRQYSGTGLGLAMTKRLVELHGGSIQVDSQVGQGSIFSVRLPMQTEQTLSAQRYQVPSMLEDHTERVILLETNEDSAAIICDMLTAAGYEVIWLVEADHLAAQMDLLQPVMLIADLALLSPDLNKIKAIQLAITAVNAKVLALMDDPVPVPSPMAHHDILHRPIDPKVLLEKVRQLTVKTP